MGLRLDGGVGGTLSFGAASLGASGWGVGCAKGSGEDDFEAAGLGLGLGILGGGGSVGLGVWDLAWGFG